VYLARDRKLDREVALKVLRPELGAVLGAERFLAEIRISARLVHPHILKLLDSGESNGMLYCVLPYVRGASLRDKLDREHRLGIDEALRITRQIASALDYAHRQHLVHRDIKPENILLQEGEAMLADFGIALAVQEAAGNRLTQTGLSLGTPQYMSPEQATGDRGIDSRSDIYSLAAVLYEMLAGEPPVTGGSAQSMIAKLLTETPTRLSVLRNTVSPALDAAVMKALSKTPADRFATAGELVRACETTGASDPTWVGSLGKSVGRRSRFVLGMLCVGLAVGIGALVLSTTGEQRAEQPAALGPKKQITSTGAVLFPAVSPDGKQLAFMTQQCRPTGCALSLVVQDVGGSTTRTILENAATAYGLEWSPDRRNLIFTGTLASRTGAFLVSALGGEPKFLTGSVATFYAGGDSLLLGPAFRPDSVYYVGVAGLDGVVHDSIRVVGPGLNLGAISVVPGTEWIVTLVTQRPLGLWQVMDRHGRVADRVVNACSCGGLATGDAVWLTRKGDSPDEAVVRIPLDRATGRLGVRQDTMAQGVFTAVSLTSDGGTMVIDQGSYDNAVFAVPFDSAARGRFPEGRRLARASSPVDGAISPDGSRLLVRRNVPVAGGQSQMQLSVMPFGGSTETQISAPATPVLARWSDAQHIAVASRVAGAKLQVTEVDVASGEQRNRAVLPDSAIRDYTALANGWAWIPASSDRIVVSEAGRMRTFPKAKWFSGVSHLVADPAHRRVLYAGWGGPGADSMALGVLSLDAGTNERWVAKAGDSGRIVVVDGHDALFLVQEGLSTWSVYAVDGPDRATRLVTIPRPLESLTVSRDGARVVANVADYRADAWMSKVVRP
ncbi:MAG TPA: protein kinase, partial [Gemmatimonadaceae bacterium]